MDVRELKKTEPKGTTNNNVPTTQPEVPKDKENLLETSIDKDITLSKDIIKEYEKFLMDEEGLTKEDIYSVLDAIITTGTVFWKFKLFNKIDVEFSMRPSWANDALLSHLDTVNPQHMAAFSNIINNFNLAASIRKYNKTAFKLDDKEDLKENLESISKFGFIIKEALIKKLVVFDRLVAVATSEFIIENFTKLSVVA